MLVMLRSAERDHRQGYLHAKVNAISEVLLQQAQQRLVFATQQEAKAEASTQVQQRFLATFSHELRTPLTAIIGNLDLLDMPEASQRDRVFQRRALTSSHMLLSLVNDILDLSRLQAGVLELNCNRFALRDVISGVEDMARTLVEQKELNLVVVVGEAVPDALLGDRMRLQQVLLNLIQNAVKFTPPGGFVALEVEAPVGRQRPPARICSGGCSGDDGNGGTSAGEGSAQGVDVAVLHVCVRDSGVGLSAAECSRIFGMFTRAGVSTRAEDERTGVDTQSGTGCGLAICKQLVQLMAGDLTVTSSGPGKGSAFTFTAEFQRAALNVQRLVSTSTAQPLSQQSERHQQQLVLVAEDNPFISELICAMLSDVCSAVAVADGVEAVAEYCNAAERGEPFDLVLMDCNMPTQDGFDATRAIRAWDAGRTGAAAGGGSSASGAGGTELVAATPTTTPIIALTAFNDEKTRQMCMDAGMDSFLTKPVQRSTLVDHVVRALEGRKGEAARHTE
jgi:signal transduction histidine kinase/DNA-binding NarL/FixJ family response regulator